MKVKAIRYVMSYGIMKDARYRRMSDEMGYEAEGIFWRAHAMVRSCGGLYPKDDLKCMRTPAKKILRVLEEYDLFEVNAEGMIGLHVQTPLYEEIDDRRQLCIDFEVFNDENEDEYSSNTDL